LAKLKGILTSAFWIGLIAGLVVGASAGAFYHLFTDTTSKPNALSEKHMISLIKSEKTNMENAELKHKRKINNTNEQKKQEIKPRIMMKEDSSLADSNNLSSVDSIKQDGLPPVDQTDSMLLPDKDTLNNGEVIMIKRDHMLASYHVECIIIKQKDLLKEDTLNIAPVKNANRKLFTVEYWQSPLNYIGYKMANNKILIFGLHPDPQIQVYSYNEKYYLSVGGQYYQLNTTFEFKPLKILDSETIIKQIEQ